MIGQSHWIITAILCVVFCNAEWCAGAPPTSTTPTDNTPIPIPELNCQIASASAPAAPSVRLFKPQQSGMSLPQSLDPNAQRQNPNGTAGGAASSPNAFGDPRNIMQQSPPGFTGGMSDQRATTRKDGPTTAKTTTRDKENWMPLLNSGVPNTNRPTTSPVAARNPFDAQNGNANLLDRRNALAGGQQPNLSQSQDFLQGQATRSNQEQTPVGASGNFMRLPNGMSMPNRDSRSIESNTRGVAFNPQSSNAATGELTIQERLAQREKMLQQEQEAIRQREAQDYVAKLRQEQLLAQQRAAVDPSNPNAQNPNAPALGAGNSAFGTMPGQTSNTQSASDPFQTPFDPSLFNQQQAGAANQSRFQAGNAYANGQSFPMGSQTGNTQQAANSGSGFANAANYLKDFASAQLGANTPLGSQVTMGVPQPNPMQSNGVSQSTPPTRDVDPRLSPADVAKLPANAYSFDPWGNPVNKGGQIVDKFGQPVSLDEAYDLTYGRDSARQRANPPADPFLTAGGTNPGMPNSANRGGRQVSGMPPIPSPSDVGFDGSGADRSLNGLEEERSQSKGSGLLPPKTRSLAAQGFLNILLLVSVIGNLYMVIWFQKMWGRYRDLIATQRAMSNPGSLTD